MAWRQRLRDLILAGGAFAVTGGCSSSALVGDGPKDSGVVVSGGGCGNANYDPCICGRPEASAISAVECQQETACQAQGGLWGVNSLTSSACTLPDGGVIIYPLPTADAGRGDGSADR
jgi:hypothetical protein